MTLIPIKAPEFDVILDIRYATTNNFVHQAIYATPDAYLHEEAAEKFQKAVFFAKQQGLKFKVFDAFRPQAAQWSLWDIMPDTPYVANPKTGSLHSRGIAIDLTLVDGQGQELDMGTEFDSFEEKAHHGYKDLDSKIQHNRYMLMGIMVSAGFEAYMYEWWHYQLPNKENYPLIADEQSPLKILESSKKQNQCENKVAC
jgi:zinc D-Ala-D-Ala dipeptidase